MNEGTKATKAAGIRLYKAGQRIIIEIDGAEDHFEQAVLNFLAAFLGAPIHSQDLKLQPVTSPKEESIERQTYFQDIILTDGIYKGLAVSQALQKYEEKALVNLFHYVRSATDEEEKEAICTACKRYMSTSLEKKKTVITNEEEMDDFIRTVAPIVDIKKMVSMFTYQSLDDFLVSADYDEKKLAFEGLIDSLIQRGMQ